MPDAFNVKRNEIFKKITALINEVSKKITASINEMGLKQADMESGVVLAGIAHAMANFIVAMIPPSEWERILEVWVRVMRKELAAQKAIQNGIKGRA